MPAETHQRSDAVAAEDVLAFLAAVLDVPHGDTVEERSLVELGCDDEMTVLHLWEVAAEEYGERTVPEVDLDELRATRTLGELARLIVAACTAPVSGGGGGHQR